MTRTLHEEGGPRRYNISTDILDDIHSISAFLCTVFILTGTVVVVPLVRQNRLFVTGQAPLDRLGC